MARVAPSIPPFVGRAVFVLTAVVAGCATAPQVPFPQQLQQIDSRSIALGSGSCATERTGVWKAEGGIVVAIRKPRGSCSFESLVLVADGRAFPLSQTNSSFVKARRFVKQSYQDNFVWDLGTQAGMVYFKTDRPLEAGQIAGILEVGCGDSNCLSEPAAQEAALRIGR